MNPGREHLDVTYRSLCPMAARRFEFSYSGQENWKKGQEIIDVLVPKNEFGLRNHPYRLYLASETGYLNNILFRRVIEEFTNWWRTTRPGLECHLVSDNLPIHRNRSIVDYAESNGIHMHNIMPGSSHWFQVHDQEPFGSLKKKMREKKNSIFVSDLSYSEGAEGSAYVYLLSSRDRSIGMWSPEENVQGSWIVPMEAWNHPCPLSGTFFRLPRSPSRPSGEKTFEVVEHD